MKVEEKEKARKLRREKGMPITKIAEKLNVSKGSVSKWVEDIELTKEQKIEMMKDIKNAARMKGNLVKKMKAMEVRKGYQNNGKRKAQFNKPVNWFLVGCMLYWAEGGKQRCTITFSNSDAVMMRIFLEFLRKYYNVKNKNVTIRINCYTNNGLNVKEIENYWLKELLLPSTCLRKTMVNRPSKYSKQLKKNKLLYGTCSLCVYRTSIVQSIYGAIQEYSGYDKPEWIK